MTRTIYCHYSRKLHFYECWSYFRTQDDLGLAISNTNEKVFLFGSEILSTLIHCCIHCWCRDLFNYKSSCLCVIINHYSTFKDYFKIIKIKTVYSLFLWSMCNMIIIKWKYSIAEMHVKFYHYFNFYVAVRKWFVTSN